MDYNSQPMFDLVEHSKEFIALHHSNVEREKVSPRSPTMSIASGRTNASRNFATERLYKDAERMREMKRIMEEEAYYNAATFSPSITRYAATIEREGKVSDRLYNNAKEMKEKKDMAIAEAIEAELSRHRRSPSSSRNRNSEKNSNVSGTSSSQTHHTLEDLYRLGLENIKQKEVMRIAADEEARAQAHPHLNPRSLQIAANLPQEKLAKLYSRSLPPTPSKEQNIHMNKTKVEDPEATFHPRIRPRSVQLAAKHYAALTQALPLSLSSPTGKSTGFDGSAEKKDELNFANDQVTPIQVDLAPSPTSSSSPQVVLPPVEERLFRQAAIIESKKQLRRDEIENAQISECTFHPRTNNSRPRRATSVEAGQRIYREQREWAMERARWIDESRADALEKELSGCTFRPNINPAASAARGRRASIGASVAPLDHHFYFSTGKDSGNKPATGCSSSSEGKRTPSLSSPGGFQLKGLDTFLERQRKGREIQDEKKNPRFLDGSGWTGTKTVAASIKSPSKSSSSSAKSAASVSLALSSPGGSVTANMNMSVRRGVGNTNNTPSKSASKPISPQNSVHPKLTISHDITAEASESKDSRGKFAHFSSTTSGDSLRTLTRPRGPGVKTEVSVASMSKTNVSPPSPSGESPSSGNLNHSITSVVPANLDVNTKPASITSSPARPERPVLSDVQIASLEASMSRLVSAAVEQSFVSKTASEAAVLSGKKTDYIQDEVTTAESIRNRLRQLETLAAATAAAKSISSERNNNNNSIGSQSNGHFEAVETIRTAGSDPASFKYALPSSRSAQYSELNDAHSSGITHRGDSTNRTNVGDTTARSITTAQPTFRISHSPSTLPSNQQSFYPPDIRFSLPLKKDIIRTDENTGNFVLKKVEDMAYNV